MATRHPPSNRDRIAQCNHEVAKRANMSLRAYKTIKAVVMLAAVATGFYAISEGADPMTTFALVALIVSGPDAWETLIGDQPDQQDDDT